MNRKNDKILIILIILLICAVLSWFIVPGMYSSGVYTELTHNRAGLYDFFPLIYSGFDYILLDLMYILIVGGCYGVLSQTKGYRKLVDKTVRLIKGKEIVAFAIVTLLMAIYCSVTSHIFGLFFIVPFIITVFLKRGYNKLTAVSAGFGGMFVGYLGLTFGTYGVEMLNEYAGISSNAWIWQKVVLFVLAYVLFTVFSVLYMKKHKRNDTEADPYYTEPLVEKGIAKKDRTKTWPVVVLLIVGLIVSIIGTISWESSFGVEIFNKLYESFQSGFMIADIPILSSIVGIQMPALGEWATLLPVGFVFLLFTIILALMSKMKISAFTKEFGNGMKKISKVAFVYGLTFSLLYMNAEFAWIGTVVSKIFGSGSFNIITLLVGAFIVTFFCVDPSYVGYSYSTLLSTAFADNLVAAGVIWRIGTAIAFVIAPTSFILVAALSYLDISYKRWLKYIWKFVAVFTIVTLLFLAVIIYM